MKIRNVYKANSIQSQLLKQLFFVLIVMLTGLGIYQYSSMKHYLYESKVKLLDSRFKNIDKNVILATSTDEMLEENMKYILNQVSGEGICVAVINQKGEVMGAMNRYRGIVTATSKSNEDQVELLKLKPEYYRQVLKDGKLSSGYQVVTDLQGKKQIIILRELGFLDAPIGLVQISTYIEDISGILAEQIRMYIVSIIGVLAIGGLLSHMVLRHTLGPLKRMTNQLDKIDSEQLNLRVEERNGQIEIDILASKFNSMFERLQKSFERERQVSEAMKHFILDASHELRTPLTSIQGFVEVLQLGAAKNKVQLDQALGSILSESQRLSKLVNELLTLVKLEGNPAVELKEENINTIIQEIVPQLQVLVRDRKLIIDMERDMYSLVNKDQIKQVIYNLVQNAINHTDEKQGEITLKTRQIDRGDTSWIEVSISDNGEGISKEKLELIFDRFYRVDKHRSRKSGGYGLGLSIVKQIIFNHKGTIWVESEEGEGSTFRFLLLLQKDTNKEF